jgi:hypothetical protein
MKCIENKERDLDEIDIMRLDTSETSLLINPGIQQATRPVENLTFTAVIRSMFGHTVDKRIVIVHGTDSVTENSPFSPYSIE